MIKLFVSDTNAFVSYFNTVFNVHPILSAKAEDIFNCALSSTSDHIKLSIPSIVFVEIYAKWFTSEEFATRFYYEVYYPITNSPNIEIKPIEREVMENLLKIRGSLSHHEINDKLILASAMMLNCPLITTDNEIIKYVDNHKVIPSTIN